MSLFDIFCGTQLTIGSSTIGPGATLWQSKRCDQSNVVIVSTARKPCQILICISFAAILNLTLITEVSITPFRTLYQIPLLE